MDRWSLSCVGLFFYMNLVSFEVCQISSVAQRLLRQCRSVKSVIWQVFGRCSGYVWWYRGLSASENKSIIAGNTLKKEHECIFALPKASVPPRDITSGTGTKHYWTGGGDNNPRATFVRFHHHGHQRLRARQKLFLEEYFA